MARNETTVAFEDINPQAPVHVLVIPSVTTTTVMPSPHDPGGHVPHGPHFQPSIEVVVRALLDLEPA